MDKRINYFIVLDTETCPIDRAKETVTPSNMLVYDTGWAVVDKHGNVYRTRSYIAREIFFGCGALMSSAYYASKIPMYWEDIKAGRREVLPMYEIRQRLLADMEEFNTNVVCAHNARFDIGAFNSTVRTMCERFSVTYMPKTVEVWDSMKMAQDTICKQPSYRKWCEEHDELTKNNQVRKTAQALYRYCYGVWDFEESHTALEDVMIEKDIVAKCFAQHKAMRKVLYEAEM